MKRNAFYHIPSLLRSALRELLKNDPLRMAAATAFFTTFALPAIIIILIQVLGLFFNPDRISDSLFDRMQDLIGIESVKDVMNVLEGFRHLASNWYITIGGFVFLIFVSTTLFKIIKSSINQVWKIRRTSKKSIAYSLKSRFKSLMVIVVAGLLFMAGVMAESVRVFIGHQLEALWTGNIPYVNFIIDILISILVVTGWFTILFRYLPDGKPSWPVAVTGAIVTSILFNTGKWLLRWLLSYSNLNTLYGTSASIVLLLLFVFYSSLILYYGAAFTKIWAAYRGDEIQSLRDAEYYELSQVGSPSP